MTERVYLASRFSRKLELRQKALDLERLGIIATSRWLSQLRDDLNEFHAVLLLG